MDNGLTKLSADEFEQLLVSIYKKGFDDGRKWPNVKPHKTVMFKMYKAAVVRLYEELGVDPPETYKNPQP